MRASSYRLLDAANSNMVGDLIQHNARRLEKKLCIRGGFQAAFPLYHMNRHKQQTRRKNQTEANLKKEMKGSYQMKKMKKACAVLLAVLSVSLLASAFAGEDNKHKVEKVENVTPVASDRPVDLDVGDLQMVAEFEQQVVGVAVSASGRVFVSFPRNGIDTVKNSVEEVIENKAVAYPNEEINTLNT